MNTGVGSIIRPPARTSKRKCGLTRLGTPKQLFHFEGFISVSAVQRLIEAYLFAHLGHFHRGEYVNNVQHGVGEAERPDRRENHCDQLLHEEAGIAVQQPGGSGRIECAIGEQPSITMPRKPPTPWTPHTSRASSQCSLF